MSIYMYMYVCIHVNHSGLLPVLCIWHFCFFPVFLMYSHTQISNV